MENNIIVRRQNSLTTTAYDKLNDDFTELFEGFEGVSIERTVLTEDETEIHQTRIYLEKTKRIYLLISEDSGYYVRVSLHCGEGTKEGEDWAYVDNKSRGDLFTYNYVRTAYGAAFSTFPYSSSGRVSLSDGYIQNFFTTFETLDGKTVNGFIFAGSPNNDTSNNTAYFVSEKHTKLETFNMGKCFYGSNANQTVLVNATSYAQPLFSRHLYKKIQDEEAKFGRIKLNGRYFISGSHFCLEYESE